MTFPHGISELPLQFHSSISLGHLVCSQIRVFLTAARVYSSFSSGHAATTSQRVQNTPLNTCSSQNSPRTWEAEPGHQSSCTPCQRQVFEGSLRGEGCVVMIRVHPCTGVSAALLRPATGLGVPPAEGCTCTAHLRVTSRKNISDATRQPSVRDPVCHRSRFAKGGLLSARA